MCIVTRQVNPSQDSWRETSGREIERLFSPPTAEAERTRSLLKLMPLSREARERYLLQVLQERYHFSGQLHDVPWELTQFMSERAAGPPARPPLRATRRPPRGASATPTTAHVPY